jgi:pilus assembly protein CpaE
MQRHDPAIPTPRRAIVISPDRALVAELEPLLNQQLKGVPTTHQGSYPTPRDAGQVLGSSPSQLIFLDVPSSPEQALALLTELSRVAGTQVLAVLAGNDPDSILKCLRAGASDFLLRPATADQLEAALSKAARLQPVREGAAQAQQAKIIAVMPAKGACGATTLACNLAFQWKRMGAKRILLADLDPLAGTMSFLLKLKSSFSFLDVLQRGHELDEDLWNSTITTSGGIDVLLAPDLAVSGLPNFTDASPILNYAREAYDVVIVDTGSVYGEWNLSQARLATDLLLVTTNELPALQSAQRALSYLEANKIGKWKTRLVVNRYQRDVGLNRDVIGTALHTEVFETIPSDYEAVQAALMLGKPVPSTTPFGKGVAQLADRIGGPSEKSKKPAPSGGLSGLLGGFFSKGKK